MSRFRYRDDDSSTTTTVLGVLAGAVAGFAVGMLVAQRVGGFSGLTSKLRRAGAARSRDDVHGVTEDLDDDFADVEEDELESEDYGETLEERVLEAYRNDPVLAERAVDIGEISDGVIELAGWVDDEHEAQHAVTIARGVPGVVTVVNRIMIGDQERTLRDAARRARAGDPSMTEAAWEGQRVGTGRRRQGTSDEADRHADPKVDLGERWLREDDAVRNAADTDLLADRKRPRRGAVPKADHVADVAREPEVSEETD